MIKIWDISYNEEIDHIQGHKGEVVCMHYNPEFPSKMMSGGAYPDDTIKVWDRYNCMSAPFLTLVANQCSAVVFEWQTVAIQRVGVDQQPARAKTNLKT
jgi:WD40 repeat protein